MSDADNYEYNGGHHQRARGLWFRLVGNRIVDTDQYRHDLESRADHQPKPAVVQSAEELVCQIVCGVATAGGCGNTALCDAAKHAGERLIDRDAAQRQAGREEGYRQGYGEAERRYQKIIDSQHALVRESAEAERQRYAARVEAARGFGEAHERCYPDYFDEPINMRNIHDQNLMLPRWKTAREELTAGDFARIRKALRELAEGRK